MLRLVRAFVLSIAVLLSVEASVFAQEELPYCPPGVAPEVAGPFEALRAQLGEAVGEPTECARTEEATGHHLQLTTTGLFYYLAGSQTPVFTNGYDHWALWADEIVHWAGASVEPPAEALAEARASQAILPHKRLVAYYGNPLAAVMGVLGEPPVQQMLARLEAQAAEYALADPSRPVQPALELVATVAQAGPGADGLYRARMAPELVEEVAAWATERGWPLILDVQVGRSSIQEEVAAMEPYLRRPYVHLALDPEFAMAAHQTPGQQIGSLDAADINWTIRYLARLVESEGLPPKILLVHRFQYGMLTNYEAIELDPRVQVVVVMDGFGGPAAKTGNYYALVRDEPVQYSGFKLFYRWDAPLLSPWDILELDPAPDVVIYQ